MDISKNVKKITDLLLSGTSKDTLTLFIGNGVSAFLGFVFVYILTQKLTVAEFGVFSAAANLIIIISSFTDLGITTAMINFVSVRLGANDKIGAEKYLKASFVLRFVSILIVSGIVLLIPKYVAVNFLSTDKIAVSYWVSIISIGLTAWLTFPYAMMAYKKFWPSVFLDWSLGIPRILYFLALIMFLPTNLNTALLAYGLSTVLPIIYGFSVTGIKFLKSKLKNSDYFDLIKFSGWLGVNRAFEITVETTMLMAKAITVAMTAFAATHDAPMTAATMIEPAAIASTANAKPKSRRDSFSIIESSSRLFCGSHIARNQDQG